MTNKIDKIGGNYHSGKAEDAGYMTQSGNHAAGIEANDTPSINREPNISNANNAGSQQSSAAGSSGGMDMTASQSIGGQNAQDGIAGTPSGTQGADAGQGVNQGGSKQSGQSGGLQRDVADKLQGGPENQQGSGQGLPGGPGEPDRGAMRGSGGSMQSAAQTDADSATRDVDDLGSKRSPGAQSRDNQDEDQR